jgi:8-oxo-dGTP diphosphatase
MGFLRIGGLAYRLTRETAIARGADMIPRLGEAVVPGIRYGLRPGVYALLRRGGSVLITHQAEPVPEYQLPGGGIDPGEQPLAALHREVLEETGWTIAEARRLGAYRRFVYMPEYDKWAEKLCTVYLARPAMRVSAPSEPGHRALWVPLGEAAGMLASAGDRAFALAEARQVSRG